MCYFSSEGRMGRSEVFRKQKISNRLLKLENLLQPLKTSHLYFVKALKTKMDVYD